MITSVSKPEIFSKFPQNCEGLMAKTNSCLQKNHSHLQEMKTCQFPLNFNS